MGLKLTQLLRYKKQITLKDDRGNLVLDSKGKPVTLWVRILGDEDNQEAHRQARIASAEKRRLLRDESTDDFKDQLSIVRDEDAQTCVDIIIAARRNEFSSEAFANVVRPDKVELKEIAVDPDAPTLEEQEKYDKAIEDQENEYRKALQDYVDARIEETKSESINMPLDELREVALVETRNAMALAAYLERLDDEKAWRSVYFDEKCTERGIESLEEFNQLASPIKRQIKQTYMELEVNPNDLKN